MLFWLLRLMKPPKKVLKHACLADVAVMLILLTVCVCNSFTQVLNYLIGMYGYVFVTALFGSKCDEVFDGAWSGTNLALVFIFMAALVSCMMTMCL